MNYIDVFERKPLVTVSLIIIGLMILNLVLIYIADAIIVEKNIYFEEGTVAEKQQIPRNASLALILSGSKNTYTELVFYGYNASCILSDVDREIANQTIKVSIHKPYKLVFTGKKWFQVYNLTGDMNYTYRVYRVEKPYSFLSGIVLFISLVGFVLSFIILQRIIFQRIVERMGRKK